MLGSFSLNISESLTYPRKHPLGIAMLKLFWAQASDGKYEMRGAHEG